MCQPLSQTGSDAVSRRYAVERDDGLRWTGVGFFLDHEGVAYARKSSAVAVARRIASAQRVVQVATRATLSKTVWEKTI